LHLGKVLCNRRGLTAYLRARYYLSFFIDDQPGSGEGLAQGLAVRLLQEAQPTEVLADTGASRGLFMDDTQRQVRNPSEFISEDDLSTFEGWLKYQGIDEAVATPDELKMWRGIFNEARQRVLTSPKVGPMKLQPVPGEHRYAVAVRDGSDLWLTLWVRRSRKGEFFVMVPRGDTDWDPHTSYHLDGTLHMKSYGAKFGQPKKLQALTGPFRGKEHLGPYSGYGPKGVGAICDPTAFSGIVEVASDVLGPRHGVVVVDLIEPGCKPMWWPFVHAAREEVFRDILPWVVIRVGS
jgi:hypothetical protein